MASIRDAETMDEHVARVSAHMDRPDVIARLRDMPARFTYSRTTKELTQVDSEKFEQALARYRAIYAVSRREVDHDGPLIHNGGKSRG